MVNERLQFFYQIRMQLSDNDMSSTADSLGLAYVTPTIAIADLRAGLNGGATNTITAATADMFVPDTQCPSIRYPIGY